MFSGNECGKLLSRATQYELSETDIFEKWFSIRRQRGDRYNSDTVYS